MHEYNST